MKTLILNCPGPQLSWSQIVSLKDKRIREQQEEIEHLKEKELQSLKARVKELEKQITPYNQRRPMVT